MANKKKSSENDSETTKKKKLEEKISNYEQLIGRLKKERAHVEDELRNDYREARRYVRSHPEEGVLISFVGGVILGILLGKLTK